MNKLLYISLLFLFISISTTSYANEFYVKGYKTNIYWKVKQGRLRAWGDVYGKKFCRKMNIDITFYNSREDITKSVYAKIGKVESNNRTPFRGKTRQYKDIRKNNWSVRDIYLRCNK